MRVCLVGAGAVSGNHVAGILAAGQELVAVCDILPESFSRAGHNARIKKPCVGKLFQYRVYAAGFIKILHICASCRSKMTKIRRFFTDLICHVEIKLDAALICNSRKMKH